MKWDASVQAGWQKKNYTTIFSYTFFFFCFKKPTKIVSVLWEKFFSPFTLVLSTRFILVYLFGLVSLDWRNLLKLYPLLRHGTKTVISWCLISTRIILASPVISKYQSHFLFTLLGISPPKQSKSFENNYNSPN